MKYTLKFNNQYPHWTDYYQNSIVEIPSFSMKEYSERIIRKNIKYSLFYKNQGNSHTKYYKKSYTEPIKIIVIE